ncbi:hypothetical protein LUZ60_017397 [Juncus effusus]|nr:hypothetical protein LUZ60_017397 [Juncus effusus]
MASITCAINHSLSPTIKTKQNSSSCCINDNTIICPFLVNIRNHGLINASRLKANVSRPANQRRFVVTSFFRFGTNGVDAKGAGIYGSQSRDDFSHYDVEQYFDYMGMLAVEGNYDSVQALLGTETAPIDILLMLAASEGDKPKIEELLRAGAKFDAKDLDGKTALDRACNYEIKQFILNFSSNNV